MSPKPSIRVLKKRSEYLAVASLRKKWVTPAFILQIAPRPACPDDIGLGLTTSKKMVGIAVQRNRARRRLRALAHALLPSRAMAGYDYVFIARKDALSLDYKMMERDLGWALKHLHVVVSA